MANMQSMNRTEALRLADALSQGRYLTTDAGNPIAEAAAELRRLHAEIERLTLALKKANEQAEHFEREWYLCGDKLENLTSVREKRQPLSDEQIDALPIVIRLRERIKHWKRESATANVWQQAIDRELVSSHLGVAGNDATQEQAGAALHELICWHVSVATDPATNGGKTLAYAPSSLELPEPVAYLFQHEDTGRTMFVDTQQVEWGFEANNPRLKKISGVYTEQQVCELLAHRGGRTESDHPQTRMDAQSEAVAEMQPAGWVAVPVEPTREMCETDWDISLSDAHTNHGVERCFWAAMLAAAPKPPTEEARDAARWAEAIKHVGAASHFGGQHFTFNTIPAPPGCVPAIPNLMQGSVAQHFTKAIDGLIAAQVAKGV